MPGKNAPKNRVKYNKVLGLRSKVSENTLAINSIMTIVSYDVHYQKSVSYIISNS